jgi:hypothetical protein
LGIIVSSFSDAQDRTRSVFFFGLISIDQRKRKAIAAPIARSMLEEEVISLSAPEFLGVSVLAEAGAAVCDTATDAADPVLVTGVSCPFNPGETCEVAAAPAVDVVEPVGEATVLEEPVGPSLDSVSKVDVPVEDPDVGPVVELDTRELETRVEEGVVELDGID